MEYSEYYDTEYYRYWNVMTGTGSLGSMTNRCWDAHMGIHIEYGDLSRDTRDVYMTIGMYDYQEYIAGNTRYFIVYGVYYI